MGSNKDESGGIGDHARGFAGLVALASDVSGAIADLNARVAAAPPRNSQDVPAAPVGPVKVRQKGRTSDVVRAVILPVGVVMGLGVSGSC